MYTQEMTDKLVEMYNTGVGVETIAETIGVTKPSVIAKLSTMGMYKKAKEKKSKETKEDYITHVENLLGLHEGQLSPLHNSNLLALRTLRNAVQNKVA